MKWLLPTCLFACLADVRLDAGPTEDAIVALMQLSDQPSYSWVATISDDARTYDIFGRTERGGFTRVKMPVINSVRRRLGRSVTDTEVEMIFRGNVECVIETDSGWRTPGELPSRHSASMMIPVAPTSTTGALSARGKLRGASILYPPNAAPAEPERAYSNLQLGISHPHEELGIIVGSHRELAIDGHVVSGVLTRLGAELLLVRDGQKNIEPLDAAGTFRIWLRGGMVARYQLKLEGVLQVSTASARRKVIVRQDCETVISDIGSTAFEVPAEARDKLRG